MCVDHPDAVSRAALLDISPTRLMYAQTDFEFAKAYYHWFFLIQPFDMPERLIGADPAYYLRRKTGSWGSGNAFFDPRAFAEYERCYCKPETIHASCEDYRAAASIDLAHDDIDVAAGRKVDVPVARPVGREGRRAQVLRPDRRLAQRGDATCADGRCRRDTTSPKRRPRKRCANFVAFFGD